MVRMALIFLAISVFEVPSATSKTFCARSAKPAHTEVNHTSLCSYSR